MLVSGLNELILILKERFCAISRASFSVFANIRNLLYIEKNYFVLYFFILSS